MNTSVRAVFFDLDGTLAETAPDLLAALNVLRAERDMPPVQLDQISDMVSGGSRKLMRRFLCREGEDVEPLRERFFAAYERQQHARSSLFDGMPEVLARIEEMGLRWAVVTNKPQRFAVPLMSMLGLDGRFCSLVCGDTLPVAKPHPEPLLKACEECGLGPQDALFLGDDPVDQKAAAACDMQFAAAGWSGIWRGSHPLVLSEPAEIIAVLGQLGWVEL